MVFFLSTFSEGFATGVQLSVVKSTTGLLGTEAKKLLVAGFTSLILPF